MRLEKKKRPYPLIRIAMIHKGMVLLKPDKDQKWDYPFEIHLKSRETLDDGVKRIFREKEERTDFPYHYVVRYISEQEENHRMVFFCVSNIQDENLFQQIHTKFSKWWTSKQLKENMNTGIFSDYLEKEYELFRNILEADCMMRGITD